VREGSWKRFTLAAGLSPCHISACCAKLNRRRTSSATAFAVNLRSRPSSAWSLRTSALLIVPIRLVRNEEAGGSSPLPSTKLFSHRVVAKPILGGLPHHEYRLEKVAA